MKFEGFPIEGAEGAMLAHAVTTGGVLTIQIYSRTSRRPLIEGSHRTRVQAAGFLRYKTSQLTRSYVLNSNRVNTTC